MPLSVIIVVLTHSLTHSFNSLTCVSHPFVSHSFIGYDMHAIVGHNCRFLQGPDTDRDQVNKLKVALTEGREEVVILKNYRKDGNIK